jgi:hypothetical protein
MIGNLAGDWRQLDARIEILLSKGRRLCRWLGIVQSFANAR